MPTVPALTSFTQARGPVRISPVSNSLINTRVWYNEQVPTGRNLRTYSKGLVSVTIVDPNGEGTCAPRQEMFGTLKVAGINTLDEATTITNYRDMVDLLKEELVPATGFTLPSAA